MSERDYKRVTRQLKPFITLFIVVMGTAFLASCGGGSGSSDPTATVSSVEEPNATAQAVTVSGGTVPGTWKGRAPLPNLQPTTKYGVIKEESVSYAKGILVVYQNPSNIKAIQEYISKKQWKIIGQEGNVIQINTSALTQADLRSAEKDAESSGLFDLVTLDYKGSNNIFSNPDPSLNDPIKYWNYGAIKVLPAWDNVSKQSDLHRVRVGLPDSGFTKVKMGSLTLKSVVTSLNESDCDVPPWDKCDNHGYHVGGIIGATGNDGNGHVGIGSGSTDLTDIYAADTTGLSTLVGYTASFINLNNRIINYSRGIPDFPAGTTSISRDGHTAAVSAAQKSAQLMNLRLLDLSKERAAAGQHMDVLFVQASGNDGRIAVEGETFKVGSEENGFFTSFLKFSGASPIYSTIASQTLIVGAFNRTRSVSEFTSLPNTPELEARFILAPGSEIYSDTRIGPQSFSGTSMAAPHVVGVASLLLQVNSSLKSRDVADIILQTSDNKAGIPWKPGDKYRYLNAEAAVTEAIRRKVEVNCGTIMPPAVAGQQGPTYVVISNRATRFSTLPAPKPNYPFGAYRWKTSEGTEILSTIEQANITFYVSSGAFIHVTPVLMDGTVCTGSTKTSNVDVNIPEWKINPANNHRYEVVSCGTWLQCRDNASALGGKLVTIRSQAENDWLAANFSMAALYWIGAYYDTTTRAWKWASGEPFAYSHWGDNLNNSGGDEYCSHFFPPTPGYWNDVRCGYEYSTKAIVEYMN